MRDIQDWLDQLGWKQRDNVELQFRSPDLRFVVILVPHMPWWALGLYDDSGEYHHLTDGATFEQLQMGMQLVPLKSRIGLESEDRAQNVRLMAMAGCTPEEIEQQINLERRS